MHFTKAVAIFISGKLALPMIDTLMTVAPGLQAGINAVLVRINKCARYDGVAYLLAADKYSGPLASRLSGINQPVIRTRNAFSTLYLTWFVCG
jgi:hypothetical protein